MTEWPELPKPEPTPIWDRWKACPECNSERTQLRCHYRERGLKAANVDMTVAVKQTLELHLHCLDCGLTSETRSADLTDTKREFILAWRMKDGDEEPPR